MVGNETASVNRNSIETPFRLVVDYEEKNNPIEAPTLIEVMKLRIYEKGLTQRELSKLLQASPSRVSEYLSGKNEPTLIVARIISTK